MCASNFDIAEWLAYEALPNDTNSRSQAFRFEEDELAMLAIYKRARHAS